MPKSVAFEVKTETINGNDEQTSKDQSLVKKHPSKRLLRLEEQQNTPRTAEEILEKQRLAQQRRRSILEEKVLKSKQLQAKLTKKRNSAGSGQDATSNDSNDATSNDSNQVLAAISQSNSNDRPFELAKDSRPGLTEKNAKTPEISETLSAPAAPTVQETTKASRASETKNL